MTLSTLSRPGGGEVSRDIVSQNETPRLYSTAQTLMEPTAYLKQSNPRLAALFAWLAARVGTLS